MTLNKEGLSLGGRLIGIGILKKEAGECVDWIDPAQGMDRWRTVVNTVMNLGGFHKMGGGKFVDYVRNCQLVKKDPARFSCAILTKIVHSQLVGPGVPPTL